MQVQGLIVGAVLASVTAVACSSSSADADASPHGNGVEGPIVTYGPKYEGGEFHLGPVDWAESGGHNACAPAEGYPSVVQDAEGEGPLLAGLWSGIPDVAEACDACIYVKTPKGREAILRVVTYGDTTKNSIDVSPTAFDVLGGEVDAARPMTWQLAKCPERGALLYQFQTGSNEDYTSLWVREPRVPIAKVEVKSKNHAEYFALVRGDDGALTDGGGFGKGAFSIKVTGIDGQEVVDTFEFPTSGLAGVILAGRANLK
ncbi:MAG: extracellular endoglucanase precursor [Labilithrix sp.]|nr:extracellular endoglucanase precursor [Labilithrix sp.]